MLRRSLSAFSNSVKLKENNESLGKQPVVQAATHGRMPTQAQCSSTNTQFFPKVLHYN